MKISVVLTAFDCEAYLDRAVASVLSQAGCEVELVIVDDASSDGTPALIARHAADERVVACIHERNQGLHCARKTGAAAATGEYLMFLDPDDELPEGFFAQVASELERGFDIVHFLLEAIPEGETSQEAADAFAAFINKEGLELAGDEVFDRCFSDFQVDWRVTQRLYRSGLAKRAFAAMNDERLLFAEDMYEYFALASSARSELYSSATGLRYHFGSGITGHTAITVETFLRNAEYVGRCLASIEDFALGFTGRSLVGAIPAVRYQIQSMLLSDWRIRLDERSRDESLAPLSRIFGKEALAGHLLREADDAAYERYAGSDAAAGERALELLDLAARIAPVLTDSRAIEHRRKALYHLSAERPAEPELPESIEPKDGIAILVSAHKESEFLQSGYLHPIQVGAALAPRRFPGMLSDATGDSISEKNKSFCELTAQYWAWKNLDAEYYGFCHYRRYFNLSDTEYAENEWGEVMDPALGPDARARYGLTDDTIREQVLAHDIIVTTVKDVLRFPDAPASMRDHYDKAPDLHVRDFDLMLELIDELSPEYSDAARAYASGTATCFCNMYVLRRDIFFEYCEWMFGVLGEFERRRDMTSYSVQAFRTPGHLSERLFNIFLLHQREKHPEWRIREVQCVHFERTDPVREVTLPSLAPATRRPIVPIALAADDAYAPMVATTIQSVLMHSSPDRLYDFILMSSGISGMNRRLLEEQVLGCANASLRICDVRPYLSRHALTTSNAHISVETYYRFIVPELLPGYDKVLYLDSDLVANHDVAELYDTELGDNLLAAVKDLDFLANVNHPDGWRMNYAHEVLGLEDPYSYFQAGVLLMNTAAFRESFSLEFWLGEAAKDCFIYDDQDILNAHCQGRVLFIDQAWNIMHDCAGRIAKVFARAPHGVFDEYLDGSRRERIIHYAGFEKPWNTRFCDREPYFWAAAERTPFIAELRAMKYDADQRRQLVARLETAEARIAELEHVVIGDSLMREDHPLRRLADPLMPYGSRRREAARNLARFVLRR